MLVLMLSAAFAADYDLPFGNITSSGCTSHWVDGDCEKFIGAFGSANRLFMSYDLSNPSIEGVAISGSSSYPYPNGITTEDYLRPSGISNGFGKVVISGHAVEGGTIRLKVNAFDTTLTLVDSWEDAFVVADGETFELALGKTVTAAANSFNVQVGIVGTGSIVFLDHVAGETVAQPQGQSCEAQAQMAELWMDYDHCHVISLPKGPCEYVCDFEDIFEETRKFDLAE